MRTLLLFRHGKSDWDADYSADHARPLAERGQKGARKMGRFITTARATPDRALVSSAVRTRETLAIAAEAGAWTGPARVTDAIYDARPEDVLREIQAEDAAAATLVVVGHEPSMSGLVHLLTGARAEMKTAAVACIALDAPSWDAVRPGTGRLEWLVRPGVFRPGKYGTLKKRVNDALEAQKKVEAAADVPPPVPPPAPAETPAAEAPGDGAPDAPAQSAQADGPLTDA